MSATKGHPVPQRYLRGEIRLALCRAPPIGPVSSPWRLRGLGLYQGGGWGEHELPTPAPPLAIAGGLLPFTLAG